MGFTDGLNDRQKEAVLHGEGAMLILAGAGSGKTRVLTHRIARLVEEGVKPWNILAITFTNKAAKEMKQRIETLVGGETTEMWIATFHSMCVRILRRDIEKLGYTGNFTIYDAADQQTVIKDCLKELEYNDKELPPKTVLSEISRAKDKLLSPESFKEVYASDFRMKSIGNLYMLYQKKLCSNNALDFDDLIRLTVELFNVAQPVLEYYQKKFHHILVDEYQDTSISQYTLINMLAQGTGNLCVVGDDDQSIYAWRGADLRNILDFEKDYDNCKIIKLEQNYRSTPNILKVANNVIRNNEGRKQKTLWTGNKDGESPYIYSADNHYDETAFVAETIIKKVKTGGCQYGDIAVLYRTNAQSRLFEERFMKEGIPYRMYGGLKFYERKEIKDTVAYLRLILNKNDDVSLRRIVNVPKRGIGGVTVEKAEAIAASEGTGIFSVISRADNYPVLSKSAKKLMDFCKMINDLTDLSEVMPVSTLLGELNSRNGIISEYLLENSLEARTRVENINEFTSVALEFEKSISETDDESTLEGFLAHISLVSDIDSMDNESGAVSLMTIHSAKGLEFPTVYLVGMDEGVFPGLKSSFFEEKLEEERRLCYVGITRAEKELYMTHAYSRTLYGKTEKYLPSRFLDEIPGDLVQYVSGSNLRPIGRLTSPVGSPNMSEKIRFPEKVKNNKTEGTGIKSGNIFSGGLVRKGFPSAGNLPKLSPGVRVVHKKFGNGSVLSVDGEALEQVVEIDFDGLGMRRLKTAYANLQLID